MSEEETKPTPEEELPETPETAEEQQPVDELTKWREMALRTAAEYDNYRKRCVKDREEFTKYATRGLLEELLPVIDNFEMGMQMAAQQGTDSMMYIGMSMVQKQLADFLAGQGVEPIETTPGQEFDHNIHEAIMSEPSDQPEGTIVRILRRGYNLRGRLLRPVNVVTAAAKEEASPEA
jgi:molecular chaperone GrpE